jgi:hypothetical protein
MSTKIYTKAILEEAVKKTKCFSDTFRLLGACIGGNSYQRLRRMIDEYKIDTSHFWDKKSAGIRKAGLCKKKHHSEVLTDGKNRRLGSKQIRRALLESGVPYICDRCKQEQQWFGAELTLQVDHKNGDWRDCRKDNLRFLCPNCHSQTSTFCNNGLGKRCKNCGTKIRSKSTLCKRCSLLPSNCKRKRKVENRPSLRKLLCEVKRCGYVRIGKKYGVSDNAVRKWIQTERRRELLEGETNAALV